MAAFDPNGVGLRNGNLFGFPVSIEEAKIIIIPVPWEVTTSYGTGTSKGPKAVLDASPQLDFYDPHSKEKLPISVAMLPISKEIETKSIKYKEFAVRCAEMLEDGQLAGKNTELADLQSTINQVCDELNQKVKNECLKWINSGKKVALLGGEHSVALSLIQAIAEKHENFGILQIDAHADLRKAYEGLIFSHASIFYNVLHCPQVSKLVQIGIRDICPAEVEIIQKSNGRIKTFFDWGIKAERYEGKTWQQQCDEIIAELPQKIYISFDIDGLDPKLCPNTGTPVAGGFQLEEISYLFNKIKDSGKKVIAFDLNEIAPGENDEWDANVGARVLYKLVHLLV